MSDELGGALIKIARNALARHFELGLVDEPAHPALEEPGATFVTLMHGADVRGCVGTLEPLRLLREDVRSNALGAAFHDTRFHPLTQREYEQILIEVSLLGPSEKLRVQSEAELLASVRVGIDGLTIKYGAHCATFLPQVWAQLHEPMRFLTELKRKAGLPGDFWSREMNVSRYQVTKWKETDLLFPHE